MVQRVATAALVVLATSLFSACGSEAPAGSNRGAEVAQRSRVSLSVFADQAANGYECAAAGGSYATCPDIKDAAQRALDLGQDLRLSVDSGQLNEECRAAAEPASDLLLSWHDGVIDWRDSRNIGIGSGLQPQSSLDVLVRAGASVDDACAD